MRFTVAIFLGLTLLSLLFFGARVMFANDHYDFSGDCVGVPSVAQEQKCFFHVVGLAQDYLVLAAGFLVFALFFEFGIFKIHVVLQKIIRIGILQPKLCE